MVGPPKRLEDLRKVEGAVRVTCRACGAVRTRDREEMIRDRLVRGQSLEWPAVRQETPCPACGSAEVRVDGVPFGADAPELRARRAAARRLHLALVVLREAAPVDSTMPLPAVQLALRVLHPFVGDRELLVIYWDQVSGARDHPWSGGHQALRWIVKRLVDRGWPVAAEFR